MLPDTAVAERMRTLVSQWQASADRRATFLDCYLLMTRNVLTALERGEFRDAVWVDRLLNHFADYYFAALDAFERDAAASPAVWQLAHHATRNPNITALQNLLLGVNAHINYDLVLATADLLRPEWDTLNEAQRAGRYADYGHVNLVICATIDAVQDQVLDPAMPIMASLDKAFGPLDELLISHLIMRWREGVWQHTTNLLAAREPAAQAEVVRHVESDALRLGHLIVL
ncbi:MAG: hypothetical protein HZB53_21955 [Chloroflexi bacterium]|nr:hypothetical protein [Chloroflexota bacterium]